ncbi:MAG: sodium:solute symporter family protein [Candidatus Marinimicrobia bacterium]|nr:sodium:solute symporter family protein [Candidatus Neomarinimicrobiota bacterium]
MQTAVVAIYLTAMILVGLALRSRIKNISDFLIAGRNLGILLTTATFAGIQLGAGVILGGAELAAQHGVWAGMWPGIGVGGGLIFAGFIAAKKLRRQGAYVPLDFFAERYGENLWVRLWAWISNIPSLLGVLGVQFMAAGTVATMFGVSFETGVWCAGGVVLIYSMLGGMWGAVVTDLVQVSVIVAAIPGLAFFTSKALAANEGMAMTSRVGELLSVPFVPQGMASTAVFNILPFLLMVSVSYDAYLRFQSAKSGNAAKWGAVYGGLIVITISFFAALIGAAGRAVDPAINATAVLPQMIQSILSPLLGGIVLAALLAAAMSTANSLVISIAGSCSRDFYNKVLHKDEKLNDLPFVKQLSRIVVAVSAFLGIQIALHFEGLLRTMIVFATPYMASMLVSLLGGLLWSRATAKAAYSAMAVGGIVGMTAFAVSVPGPFEGLFNADLALLIAWSLSTVVFILVTFMIPGKGEIS